METKTKTELKYFIKLLKIYREVTDYENNKKVEIEDFEFHFFNGGFSLWTKKDYQFNIDDIDNNLLKFFYEADDFDPLICFNGKEFIVMPSRTKWRKLVEDYKTKLNKLN